MVHQKRGLYERSILTYQILEVGDDSFLGKGLNQVMVNWWFRARWFGIRIGVPLSNIPFEKRDLRNPKPGPKPPITLPETNIFAPKNGWLEYYFPIEKAYFWGLC